MSFLRTETVSESKNTTTVHNYSVSDCTVRLTLAPVPTGHSARDPELEKKQLDVINQIESEEPHLFTKKECLLKSVSRERQYKQAQQYRTNVTLESLRDIMTRDELCLKVSFVRPGFNSSNSVYMVSVDKLKNLMEQEADSNGLKKQHLSIGPVDSAKGFATLTIQQRGENHIAYSVDFTMHEDTDEKMRCEYK